MSKLLLPLAAALFMALSGAASAQSCGGAGGSCGAKEPTPEEMMGDKAPAGGMMGCACCKNMAMMKPKEGSQPAPSMPGMPNMPGMTPAPQPTPRPPQGG